MTKMKVKIGKHPDEMGFDECMAHVRRVLFCDPIDGQWTNIDFLNINAWDRLAGYITDAHGRELESLRAENDGLRRQNLDLKCNLGDELEELEGYNQTLRDRLRQQTELRAKAESENAKLRRFVTIRDHCIAGGCDLCQYRKNRESEDVECELDELGRELGI